MGRGGLPSSSALAATLARNGTGGGRIATTSAGEIADPEGLH